MRYCIRIPRILLPESGYEKWSVIACDQFTSDPAYWERVERQVGGAPSTLRMILPEIYLGEDDEARIEEIHENMYEALESGKISKLNRGCVLCERTTKSGVRRGIVAAIDLEAYTTGKGEVSPIRSSEEVVPSRLPARVAVRKGAPIEFPHAMIFYKDKKNKIVRMLLNEDLEELYDFDLMEGGGHLTGYFIPEYMAEEAVRMMHGKDDPSFAVADGNHSVAAAKAYWEELKAGLSEAETRNHPARFTLVELVNLYDEAVEFHPIHRLLKDVDAEAFCSYFMKSVKCRRAGNVLYPALPADASAVEKTDALVEAFLKANGGKIDYIHGENNLKAFAAQEDCVGIVLKPIEKDGFFERLKGGGNFPKKTFSVGEDTEKRYYTEGREISYD
ncbi:MAG: DUF1015 domain-containing protein [Clostridia bacterium]|nr:DUF1015 domain-containing protein [Clostridia bacterium]